MAGVAGALATTAAAAIDVIYNLWGWTRRCEKKWSTWLFFAACFYVCSNGV
jgi:hypothetical protein